MRAIQRLQDLSAQAPERKYKGVRTESLYLAMRDGTQIAVDVLLPFDLEPDERIPAVLTMTRYWRSFELRVPEPRKRAPIAPRESLADDLVPRGFAMIVVDGRGSGASTGISRHPWAPEEIGDYGEVAEWVAAQPWCNGNIGATGISYEGTTALMLTTTGVPAVKGVAPGQFEFDLYTDIVLPGGIFNDAFVSAWSSGNKYLDKNRLPSWFPIPWFVRWLLKGVRPVDSDRKSRRILKKGVNDHRMNTDVYAGMSQITCRDDLFANTGVTLDDFSLFTHKAAVEASGSLLFTSGSWLDGATADTVVRMFNTFGNAQIAVIGAWSHDKTTHGSPYRKPKSDPDPAQDQQWAALARFFEQTLGNEETSRTKTLFYYTLGEEIWKATTRFPLPNAETQTWYFHDDHRLSTEEPQGETGSDVYRVDFRATTGTNNRWHTELARPVIYRDRAREDRRLLTYTSTPLPRDLEITGYPVVTLHVASSEEDGAFFVYLEDVDEEGVVRYLTEGMLRGMHRKLSDETPPYETFMPYRTFKRADAMPLPRGEPVELTFGLLPVSVLIRQGHRIRVAIAGADKETFVRIPAQGKPALHIFRNRLHPSSLRLPVAV